MWKVAALVGLIGTPICAAGVQDDFDFINVSCRDYLEVVEAANSGSLEALPSIMILLFLNGYAIGVASEKSGFSSMDKFIAQSKNGDIPKVGAAMNMCDDAPANSNFYKVTHDAVGALFD